MTEEEEAGGKLEDVHPCKTTLTENAIAVKPANTRLNPGAHEALVHAHFQTLLISTGTQSLSAVNPAVKLHLTAFICFAPSPAFKTR